MEELGEEKEYAHNIFKFIFWIIKVKYRNKKIEANKIEEVSLNSLFPILF